MRKTSPTLPSRPLSHVTLITDKYPPHVAGGAELSIHTTVSHIVPSVQVHVINIDHDDTHRRERPHHATLHPLPLSQDVPALGALDSRFHIVPAVWLKRFKRWFGGRAVYGLVAGYSFYARYIFTATAVSRWHKTKLMYLNFFCYLFDSKNLEFFDEDYLYLQPSEPLRDCIREQNPDVVHADNTRSILRYQETGLSYRSVAVVRDLTFICPRRVKIAHTKQGPCTSCAFECIPEEKFAIRSVLKGILLANKRYRQAVLKRFDHIVVTSRFMQEWMEREIQRPVSIISNPIAISQSTSPPTRHDTLSILYVGILNPNKGPDVLIRAVATLKHEFANLETTIAGGGQMQGSLEALATVLQTPVRFTGFLKPDDLERYYRSADIVVCPTRWPEPFGRVLLEAMGHGCIVVASDSGAFSDHIVHGVNGFLCKPDDVRSLAETLRHVITRLDTCAPIRREAMAYARTFHPSVSARAFEQLYRTLCS